MGLPRGPLLLACTLAAGLMSLECSPLGPLPAPMAQHRFAFIIGSHHSGTTLTDLLLAENTNVSALRDTHKPQDEGQHLQKVYPTAHELGGILGYAFHPDAHMDEMHALATEEARQALFGAWAPFWNLSATVLVEKSPRHITMTRYLQAIFSPEQSRFLVVLRHPIGSWFWALSKSWPYASATCGRRQVEHWLKLHEDLERDLPHLHHVRVFQFEQLLNVSREVAQAMVDRMMEFVNLTSTVDVVMDETDKIHAVVLDALKRSYPSLFSQEGTFLRGPDQLEALVKQYERMMEARRAMEQAVGPPAFRQGNPPAALGAGARARPAGAAHSVVGPADPGSAQGNTATAEAGAGSRRRLLGYWGGSRAEVVIHAGTVYEWVEEWNKQVNMSSGVCQTVIRTYEKRLNRFGYSLSNLYLHGAMAEPLHAYRLLLPAGK